MSASRARTEVAAAELLDPDSGDLRELGVALAAGATSGAHVQVAVRAMTRVPGHLRSGRRGELAGVLTEHATTWAPEASDRLAGHLLAVLDPDGTDRYDPAALDRRSLSMAVDSTGMVITRGQHDPVAGAFIKATIDALARIDRTTSHPSTAAGDDGRGGQGGQEGQEGREEVWVRDLRSTPQRRADALELVFRAGVEKLACGDTAAGVAASMTRLIVTATLDQLAAVPGAASSVPGATAAGSDNASDNGSDAGTDDPDRDADAAAPRAVLDTSRPGSATCVGHGPLDPGTLQVLGCDAVIDRVILDSAGAVVSMTSRSRFATPGMVRALVARDGGCAFPACTTPPGLTDAHHARWWSRGGPTELANLVLLCGVHHRTVHAGDWDVTMRDGVPWFRPPYTLDPNRRWLRNTYTDAAHRARTLAQHLAADPRRNRPHWWEPPDVQSDRDTDELRQHAGLDRAAQPDAPPPVSADEPRPLPARPATWR